MNTTTIDKDPINGSFFDQLRQCRDDGTLQSGKGPLVEIIPAFWKKELIERLLRENANSFPKLPSSLCGKFGGMCSNLNCRENHQKLTFNGALSRETRV